MSRKHFEALAAALARTEAPLDVVEAVAEVCAASNSLFDRGRFFTAATRREGDR